jgi:trimeric autotransporter adhesin
MGAGSGAVLAFLVFLGIPARRRSWRSMVGALVLMMVLGSMAGCGDFWQAPSGNTAAGTTTGNYVFTVTGTGDPQVTAVTTTFTVSVN